MNVFHFVEIGDYESVLDLTGPPDLSGTDGEALLLQGIAVSQRGVAEQTIGDQELAKDCLTRAMQFLNGESKELSQVYLSLCYWRMGEFDDALALLEGVYTSNRAKFSAGLTKAMIAFESGEPEKSLQLLGEIESLSSHVSEASQGKFHNHVGAALWFQANRDKRPNERAGREFETAIYFWTRAGAPKLQAIATNNLASVHTLNGAFPQAHESVDQALDLAGADKGLQAKFRDQKAKIYLAEGRSTDAIVEVRKALLLVAAGEQKAIINECLNTLHECTKPDVFRLAPLRDHPMPIYRFGRPIFPESFEIYLDVRKFQV